MARHRQSMITRHAAVLVTVAVLAVAAASPAQQRPHWSDLPLRRPEMPAVVDAGWEREPLDRFVRAAQREHGLEPAPECDRATWLRRASLDLRGLPPLPEELAAFVQDDGDDAFARAFDRMVADPAYGERWAQWWLDLARYADSQGYEKDDLRRSMWRWRDWVIDAFAADMPFDEFTIEQLAGDLLPEATIEQRLATAFHRQTMTNTEGGTDDEEFRTAAVIDRVNTTMSVWMASTLGCAQCHDHKYDRFTQRDYFRLYAFFDQTADADRADETPVLRVPTAAQRERLAAIDQQLAAIDGELRGMNQEFLAWLREQQERLRGVAAAAPQLGDWQRLGPLPARDFDTAFTHVFAPELGVDLQTEQEGQRWVAEPGYQDGAVHTWRGDNAAVYLHRTIDVAAPVRLFLRLGSDDALVVFCNGVEVLRQKVARAAEPDQEIVGVDLHSGRNEVLLKIVNGNGPGGFAFGVGALPYPSRVANAVALLPQDCTGEGLESVRRLFGDYGEAAANVRARRTALQAEREQSLGPAVPVLEELGAGAMRTTRLFLRGSFLSPGETVTPAVPACFAQVPETAPKNRLALARWLVARDNPLTARVQVNRIWEQLFGRGLVATSEDFGRQGEPPSHPELLDWLASGFVDEGWSLRRLLRHLVLSATYRQSAAAEASVRERDPRNVWLARGPSFRLPGELLRDQALAVSGLLQKKVGGPSVMPFQPEGVWGQIYSGERWQTSAGGDAHRRSLYTMWRRTSPHPAMTTFDAPSREFCVVRRVRTNTPLQTLVLWNDPQFTECAQALGARVLQEHADGDDVARLRRLYELTLLRAPRDLELQRLLAFVAAERAHGSEAVVWTRCASILLALDEFVCKP